MRLVLDIIMIFYMLVFAYAIGRRRSDGERVIPAIVTLNASLVIIGIFVLLNIPSIFHLISSYGE
ncbi:MAG: hypothetical protein ACI35P_01645 [Bacillus sp. (in: firmicutes)]